MFQTISLIVAFIGSTIAAAWDLKTTEIPDWISYAMIGIAILLYSTQSVLTLDYWPILNSAIVGSLLFGFGYIMYHFGQWGGGDVKILSAIGFLLPTMSGNVSIFPFPISYLFNVFFVGAIYMMFYALVIAVMNKKIITVFKKDLMDSRNLFVIGSVALFAALVLMNFVLYNYFLLELEIMPIATNSLFITSCAVGIFLIMKFARAVENVGFKRRIPISKLRVGDVLLDSKVWEGITEKELKKIKRSGKRYVRIKEGVRFAPAFPIGLLFTLYFGDAILFLVGVIS